MNTPLEKLIEGAGEGFGTLTETERERIRALLAEYAAWKPVRPAPGRPRQGFHILMRPAFAGALIAVLLIGTGGAAYAAEGTLPGDLLYPVKVSVTEPVVTALTPSGSAQVSWQITIAKRRLKEAATLSSEGRLATSTEATLTSQAADATLRGAADAAALTTPDASTTASTTEALIKASRLLLEGRDRREKHDDEGASRAFRASIHAAAKLQAFADIASTTFSGSDWEDDGRDRMQSLEDT